MQTIKYAKVRAKQDPDYVARKHSGVFYGTNLPYRFIDMKLTRKTTRGSVVK